MTTLEILSPPRLCADARTLEAPLNAGFILRISALAPDVLRVAIVPEAGLACDRSWMIAPQEDTPLEGRNRLSLDGFDVQEISSGPEGYHAGRFRFSVDDAPLRLSVDQEVGGVWHRIFDDRAGGAYQWFAQSKRFKHFQHLVADERHLGLGDKTGELDRTGRRLRCLQSDALGYNAQTSDPLYKHAPWLLLNRANGISAGLLYDTMAQIDFDLGAEHSNYFERYRHVEAQEDGLVYYVIAGPSLSDVVPGLHRLTGMPAFPPRWSLGFAFTSMHHADAPDAQNVITRFALEARRRQLPLSAIHLGSGYSSGKDGKRYVFTWNLDKFPDRDGFFQTLCDMGLRTCANVKPVLLTGHPNFPAADANGYFVRRADGGSAIEMFWGGQGASLDFTNLKAAKWWARGIETQILKAGFDGVWNDNNEAELWDENAQIDGFGAPLSGMEMRPVHALLMTRTSYETMRRVKPDERPYTISRAGPIGIARYGETWSGDNGTSWHTLKWNLRQGLSMAISGFPFVGHDVGGFDGPPPDGELLVRWFQMMALHPRCVMNSWKLHHNNIPNLPWMHEAHYPHIRAALELRARFMPLIYSLAHRAHRQGHPLIAPVSYVFGDEAVLDETDIFMLGEDVLVAPVVEPGVAHRRLRLPCSGTGWVDYHTGAIFADGEDITLAAPLEQLPLLVRGNAVLPLARSWAIESPHDAQEIELCLFAAPFVQSTAVVRDYMFDDGISWAYADGGFSRLHVRSHTDVDGAGVISVEEQGDGTARPALFARRVTSGDLVVNTPLDTVEIDLSS